MAANRHLNPLAIQKGFAVEQSTLGSRGHKPGGKMSYGNQKKFLRLVQISTLYLHSYMYLTK